MLESGMEMEMEMEMWIRVVWLGRDSRNTLESMWSPSAANVFHMGQCGYERGRGWWT